jgi:hypothetical protein
MNPLGYLPPKTPGRFKVGDRVRITVGLRGAEAEILEDHGPLGVGGRRFYTIHMKRGEGAEDYIIDYPEDEMEPFPAEADKPEQTRKKKR